MRVGVTPVPIPNTLVKTDAADNTWLETTREDRWLPDLSVSDIMECPIEETFKKGWPFYLAIVCVILFMIFFPQAVLFLPNLVYGA